MPKDNVIRNFRPGELVRRGLDKSRGKVQKGLEKAHRKYMRVFSPLNPEFFGKKRR